MSKSFKVFNVEFDGMDKCGKDSIAKQIFAVDPNKYIINVRGIMSQIAYSHLWDREYVYNISKGYLENTLFVYLTVNEDDWNVRCKLSRGPLALAALSMTLRLFSSLLLLDSS